MGTVFHKWSVLVVIACLMSGDLWAKKPLSADDCIDIYEEMRFPIERQMEGARNEPELQELATKMLDGDQAAEARLAAKLAAIIGPNILNDVPNRDPNVAVERLNIAIATVFEKIRQLEPQALAARMLDGDKAAEARLAAKLAEAMGPVLLDDLPNHEPRVAVERLKSVIATVLEIVRENSDTSIHALAHRAARGNGDIPAEKSVPNEVLDKTAAPDGTLSEERAKIKAQYDATRRLINSVLLSNRERIALMLQIEGKTLEEIGAVIPRDDGTGVGVTKERARQLANKAITKINGVVDARKFDPSYAKHLEEGLVPWLQFELGRRGWTVEELGVEGKGLGAKKLAELQALIHNKSLRPNDVPRDLYERIVEAFKNSPPLKEPPGPHLKRMDETLVQWIQREFEERNWDVDSLRIIPRLTALVPRQVHQLLTGSVREDDLPLPDRVNLIHRLQSVFLQYSKEQAGEVSLAGETTEDWIRRAFQTRKFSFAHLMEAGDLTRIQTTLIERIVTKNSGEDVPPALATKLYWYFLRFPQGDAALPQ